MSSNTGAVSEHPLFCFTHRQFGCVHDKMQDDCEFVTANGLCDRLDRLTADNAELKRGIVHQTADQLGKNLARLLVQLETENRELKREKEDGQ